MTSSRNAAAVENGRRAAKSSPAIWSTRATQHGFGSGRRARHVPNQLVGAAQNIAVIAALAAGPGAHTRQVPLLGHAPALSFSRPVASSTSRRLVVST
jgi:hypothetical protein